MQPGFYFIRFRGAQRLAFVRSYGTELIIELIDQSEEWGRSRVYLSLEDAQRIGLQWQPRLTPDPWPK